MLVASYNENVKAGQPESATLQVKGTSSGLVSARSYVTGDIADLVMTVVAQMFVMVTENTTV